MERATPSPLTRLMYLKHEFESRQLAVGVTYLQHDWSPEKLPTLVCGEYLGGTEVTVNDYDLYTWLNGSGSRMYLDCGFPHLVVEEVIRTRAGVCPTPRLPKRLPMLR
ncbi:hypothetical protein [Nocardiopsis sp. NPDC055824]